EGDTNLDPRPDAHPAVKADVLSFGKPKVDAIAAILLHEAVALSPGGIPKDEDRHLGRGSDRSLSPCARSCDKNPVTSHCFSTRLRAMSFEEFLVGMVPAGKDIRLTDVQGVGGASA